MADKFDYRTFTYDHSAPVGNETKAETISKILNANGAQGFELAFFDDEGSVRTFYLKRRISN